MWVSVYLPFNTAHSNIPSISWQWSVDKQIWTSQQNFRKVQITKTYFHVYNKRKAICVKVELAQPAWRLWGELIQPIQTAQLYSPGACPAPSRSPPRWCHQVWLPRSWMLHLLPPLPTLKHKNNLMSSQKVWFGKIPPYLHLATAAWSNREMMSSTYGIGRSHLMLRFDICFCT